MMGEIRYALGTRVKKYQWGLLAAWRISNSGERRGATERTVITNPDIMLRGLEEWGHKWQPHGAADS